MSILIEAMEMPKRGMVVNIYADGRVTNHFDEFGKTIGKAVPVPPHGRLIDADALDIYQRAEAAYAEYQEDEDNFYLEGMAMGLCEAAKQLSAARTIIPASVEIKT